MKSNTSHYDADVISFIKSNRVTSLLYQEFVCFFLPEFEYMFPLLVVIGHLTHSLTKADGYLAVVWNAIASALAVFIEAKASFSYDTVHILPGPMEAKKWDFSERQKIFFG